MNLASNCRHPLWFPLLRQYYRNVLLSHQLLPAIKHVAGNTFVFQQDNAPFHRAKDAINLLQQEMPDFTGPDLWPPNNPDLNPVDDKVWSVMQQRMYKAMDSSVLAQSSTVLCYQNIKRSN